MNIYTKRRGRTLGSQRRADAQSLRSWPFSHQKEINKQEYGG